MRISILILILSVLSSPMHSQPIVYAEDCMNHVKLPEGWRAENMQLTGGMLCKGMPSVGRNAYLTTLPGAQEVVLLHPGADNKGTDSLILKVQSIPPPRIRLNIPTTFFTCGESLHTDGAVQLDYSIQPEPHFWGTCQQDSRYELNDVRIYRAQPPGEDALVMQMESPITGMYLEYSLRMRGPGTYIIKASTYQRQDRNDKVYIGTLPEPCRITVVLK